ncbi:MAG: EF-P beta-lysylation protein EpmB [Gammaproteobacteria bacterium]|nr:EF-P beta-lysylation protein EpmB [Gammaproteobacteria bacterium]
MQKNWQKTLNEAVRDPGELLRLLELPASPLAGGLLPVNGRRFGLCVPRGYVARMRKGDPADPLLRQVLPDRAESRVLPGFAEDPTGDSQAQKTPGLLHKYQGRVLLLVTRACAIHCRYCFRRHLSGFLFQEQKALDYIRADPSITEIILSGGDPLLLEDARLAELIRRLAAIPHVRRLRVHTRLPVVLPERVSEELLNALCGTRLQTLAVIHANHANELDDAVQNALSRLTGAGIMLFNQSVLLRGVNDNAKTLIALSEALCRGRVTPYYLHLPDRVQGSAHFAVSERLAEQLLEALRLELSGYLVPKLVREIAGMPYKQPY